MHQGKIVNKFTDHLPALQSKLVQEDLKENYDFGFDTVEHEIYDETELEEGLNECVCYKKSAGNKMIDEQGG